MIKFVVVPGKKVDGIFGMNVKWFLIVSTGYVVKVNTNKLKFFIIFFLVLFEFVFFGEKKNGKLQLIGGEYEQKMISLVVDQKKFLS